MDFELFGMDGWTDTPSVVFVLSYFSCFKVCRCDVFLLTQRWREKCRRQIRAQ